MINIDKSKPVLITGGSGYIASWIVRLYLENGFTVRTTVRKKSATEKISHLLKLAEEFSGKLELYEADLLIKDSFLEPMTGCELVVHTASPFFISGIKDAENQLIKPAKLGTSNVLDSVNQTETVKKVVLTSSVAAIYSDAADAELVPNRIFTEKIWNTTSNSKHQPYSYSKTIAEQEAWEICKKQLHWELVVINPGLVLGPSLTERIDSTSIDLLLSLMNGEYKSGAPKLYFAIVDVRDVAHAHYMAGTRPDANGRNILVADVVKIIDLARILKRKFPEYPIPTKEIPNFLFYLAGPFIGYSWKAVKLNANIPMKFDNSFSKTNLGIEYKSIENTIIDHAKQVINSGLLKNFKTN